MTHLLHGVATGGLEHGLGLHQRLSEEPWPRPVLATVIVVRVHHHGVDAPSRQSLLEELGGERKPRPRLFVVHALARSKHQWWGLLRRPRQRVDALPQVAVYTVLSETGLSNVKLRPGKRGAFAQPQSCSSLPEDSRVRGDHVVEGLAAGQRGQFLTELHSVQALVVGRRVLEQSHCVFRVPCLRVGITQAEHQLQACLLDEAMNGVPVMFSIISGLLSWKKEDADMLAHSAFVSLKTSGAIQVKYNENADQRDVFLQSQANPSR